MMGRQQMGSRERLSTLITRKFTSSSSRVTLHVDGKTAAAVELLTALTAGQRLGFHRGTRLF